MKVLKRMQIPQSMLPGDTVAQLTAMIESAPIAFVMIDKQGQIVLANHEADLLFGYQRDELIGQPVEILVPERFRTNHPDLRLDFFQNPQARPMGAGRDLYGLRHDGSEFPVEIGLNPIVTEQGEFVLSAIVNITERKAMEAALRNMNDELEKRVTERTAELARSNEALERSNLDLQQFAYVASHDLQAPLRSIVGFVQLLQDEYGERLDDQGQDWINRTIENSQRMQTLILDLLTYARLETQARPFRAADCERIVQKAIASLETAIHDTGAEVTHGPLPTVVGDESQLTQVFQNLIANGLKYSPGKPEIHISAQQQDRAWLFAIRDNGIGIATKYHERIFDIFQRLHTQQTYPGTGIGLAICRRVVQRHGGRIWVESEPDQGSTFYFTLAEQEQDHHE